MIVNLTENRSLEQVQKVGLINLEFIMLLKGNLPPKINSYGNILSRNYLSYIFEFQLVPFAFSLILGDPFMVSPPPLSMEMGDFFPKIAFHRGQTL